MSWRIFCIIHAKTSHVFLLLENNLTFEKTKRKICCIQIKSHTPQLIKILSILFFL